MLRCLAPIIVLIPAAAACQTVAPGSWDVTSRVVDFAVPGVPGFVARMIRGKSKAEHKRLVAGQGIAELLAPDPKAHCRIEAQRIADGRYAQTLTCPQPHGEAMHVARIGTYDGAGFAGRATLTGSTPKGPVRIALDQHAALVGAPTR